MIEIEKILTIQDRQNKFWYDKENLTPEQKVHILYEHLLGINLNTTKILGTVDWQKSSLTRKIIDKNDLMDNLTDVVKHFLSIMLLYDLNLDDLYNRFIDKTEIVNIKIKNIMKDVEKHKFISIDIDGIVADFYNGFTDFLSGKGYQIRNKYHDTYDMATLFGGAITFEKTMNELMKEFMYENNGFLNLDVINGSVENINKLIDDGYKIIFVTGRDNKTRIVIDTIRWLNKIGIKDYKHITFNKDKVEAITALKPINIICHIEDRDKHAVEVASLKIKVFLLRKQYNKTLNDSDYITVVNNWNQIYEFIKKMENNNNES